MAVFIAMEDLASQSDLLLSLKDELREEFKEALTPDRKKELFYFRHFSIQDQTNMSSEDFINELLSDHYAKNN